MPGEYSEYKQIDYEIHREEVQKYGWAGRPKPSLRKKILHAIYWLSTPILVLVHIIIFSVEFGVLFGLILLGGLFFVFVMIPFYFYALEVIGSKRDRHSKRMVQFCSVYVPVFSVIFFILLIGCLFF